MLKIKDNVDLSILKKYGFKKYTYYMEKKLEDENYLYISLKNDFFHKNRELSFYLDEYKAFANDLDTLYDLIKADLVEKGRR